MQRQQRRVELDHAVLRDRYEGLRRELRDIGHHAELDVELLEGAQRFGRAEALELKALEAFCLRRLAQRIGPRARRLRCRKNACHIVAALEEGFECRFTESLLTDDGKTHGRNPFTKSRI